MEKPAVPQEPKKRTGSLGLRLLIMLAIVILACITLRSAVSLGRFIITSIQAGTGWTGNFWSEEFPIMVLAVIVALGSFGIYKLIPILKK